MSAAFSSILLSFILTQVSGWVRFYGGVEREWGSAVQPTSDGGYVVTGGAMTFEGLWLLKLNEAGDTSWTRTWEGSGAYVSTTKDGGYIAVGDRTPPGEYKQVLLIKADSLGNEEWVRFLGEDNQDRGNCVIQTFDGSYVVAGYKSFLTPQGPELYIIKVDGLGDVLWTKSYAGYQGFAFANFVQETRDSGYIVVGYTGYYEDDEHQDRNIWLVKTDIKGDTLWTRTYGDSLHFEHAECVRQTADGGFAVVGWSSEIEGDDVDLRLIKTDSTGDTLWTGIYGGEDWDEGNSVLELADGGYVVTGYTRSFGQGNADLWLLRIDEYGEVLWAETYGAADWDEGLSVALTPDGGYIATGITSSFGAGSLDLLLIKVDSTGNLPLAISPILILDPGQDSVVCRTSPKAQFTNLSNRETCNEGFTAHCEIDNSSYHDSVKVSDVLSPWQSVEVEFAEWVADVVGEYSATFYATGNSGDSLASVPMSCTFRCTGISESPVQSPATWGVITSAGPRIELRYINFPQGFSATVFDASGRKVDEMGSTKTSGTITWGEGFLPGVYFVVLLASGQSRAQKVVLIK
ncbi:T9SS type A sorting domain-containing protein [candidate division WOR-3 bacterium]|nr:T9SS type A sorting domain-containing protein [candidate division WOR-3 bacterium]